MAADPQATQDTATTQPDPDRITDPEVGMVYRERRCLELRATRMSYHEIARQVGYQSASGAYRAVKRAMVRTQQEPADELRRLECETLDLLIQACMTKALDQASGQQLQAIAQVKGLMERKAALLGLDAPTRRIVDVVTGDAFSQSMLQLEQEMRDAEQRLAAAGIAVDDDEGA